ncbi:MAG: hypothetical protein RL442_2076, partial [Pseudomonadota bacterium]
MTGAPVVVAPRRATGVALLERAGVDLIVCDDGLQHLALARDLEIVVIDAQRGFGNGRRLPAGPLREAPSRLAAVDFVVVQGARVDALGTDVPRAWQGWHGTLGMQLALQAAQPVRLDEHSAADASRPLAAFAGAPVHAVAGIGNPTRFFDALRAAGLTPIEHPFPDHHAFRAIDLEFGDTAPVLMTAKDAVKCRTFAAARCWQVPATAHGFRSTFRDWASERTAVPSEVAEMALAHAVGDQTEAAYRRGDLFDKRRELMTLWAKYIETPVTGGNVQQLTKRRTK